MSRTEALAYLQRELATEAGRQRAGVLAIATALCVFSLIWGLGGTGSVERNPLGASAESQVSRAGSVFFVVANGSAEDWEQVRFVADDRWYLHVPRVASLEQIDLRMDTFSDSWRIPRARGTEAWEALLPTGDERSEGPGEHPARLRIETGGLEVELALR